MESIKTEKEKGELDKVGRSDEKMNQMEAMMERNVNSVEELTNKENVLHIGKNFVNARRKMTGQTAVTLRRFMNHQLHQKMILC